MLFELLLSTYPGQRLAIPPNQELMSGSSETTLLQTRVFDTTRAARASITTQSRPLLTRVGSIPLVNPTKF